MQTLHVIISFKYEDKYIKTDVTVLTLCRNDLRSDAAEIVSLNIKTTGSST